MLNHIIAMGRLTKDPELRYTQTNIPVASFTIAVDRDYSGKDGGEKQTDFINCVAWRQTGEFVTNYFSKGSMIVVCGRLEIRQYKDKEGNNRIVAEINADRCYFGESKRDNSSQNTPQAQYSPQQYAPQAQQYHAQQMYPTQYDPRYAQQQYQQSAFNDLEDGGELPF